MGQKAADHKTDPALLGEERSTYLKHVARMLGLATNFEVALARLPKKKRQVYVDEHNAVAAARRQGKVSELLGMQLD
jgi:hypothetical protein